MKVALKSVVGALFCLVQVSGCKVRSQSDPKMLALVQDKRFGNEQKYALINNIHSGIAVEVAIDVAKIWLCDRPKPPQIGAFNDPLTLATFRDYGFSAADIPAVPGGLETCVKRGDLLDEVFIATEAWLQTLRDMGEKNEIPLIKGTGAKANSPMPIPHPIVYSIDRSPAFSSTLGGGKGGAGDVYFYDQSGQDKVRLEKAVVPPQASLVIKFQYALDRSFATTSQFPLQVDMFGKIAPIPDPEKKFHFKDGSIFTASYKTPKLPVHNLYYNRGVLMHEIGHTIGLADTYRYGTSESGKIEHGKDGGTFGTQPPSVMNGTYLNDMNFTSDDRAGLAWLYGFFVNKSLSDPTSCPNNYRHDTVTNGCLFDSTAQDDVKAGKCTGRFGHYDRGACFCPIKKNAIMEIDGTDLCLEDKKLQYSTMRMETGKEFGFHYIVCRIPEANRFYQIRWMNLEVDSKAKIGKIEILTDAKNQSSFNLYQRQVPIADIMGIINSVSSRKPDDLENFMSIADLNFGPSAGDDNVKLQECQIVFNKKYNGDTGVLTL